MPVYFISYRCFGALPIPRCHNEFIISQGDTPDGSSKTKSAPKVGDNLVEGPIVNKEERDDVVADQDDVDDLLSSLGF